MTPFIARRFCRHAAVLFALVAIPRIGCANIEITLKNDFIEKYKDTATIDVSFVVDKAHPRPNPPKADGDLHAAGRAEEVGLPIVAEIMNAASQKAAVDAIHKVEGSGNPIPLTGIWRLWCEHGGDSKQVQGEALEPFTTTNPPHVFEIHPISKLDTSSLLSTFHPITGYKPKDAETAFLRYEALKCHITVGSDTTSLTTTMAGYNYVEFVLVPLPNEKTEALGDGGTGVLAEVHSLDGDLLVHKRRMVFAKGSPEQDALKGLTAKQGLHVLGVPRISMKLLSFRVSHHAENEQMLDWGLPYEIAIVGFYGKVTVSE